MRNNHLQLSSNWLYINGWIFSTFITFILAGAITSYSTAFTSNTLKSWLKDMKADELFIHFLEAENHYFYSNENKKDLLSISDFTFKLATNIQPTDIRTFLGSELPGFPIFDTEIVIAGEGTDFTTLPIESAPPIEVLLREREIAMQNLKEQDEEKAGPPVTGKKSVLIYHTHSWEAFLPLLDGVTKTNEAVSANEEVNVLAVGEKLAEELAERGIGVEHLNDQIWDYNKAYSLSRKLVQEATATNQDLQFFIDIHRDSQQGDVTIATINGKMYARLFFF